MDTVVNGLLAQVDLLGRPGGSQGFPGFQPADETNENRTNLAGYLDAEFDFTDNFMVGAALRAERYSDFGSTVNSKIAARYEVSPRFAFRASASTGFRAASLPQIFFSFTFTDFVSGVPVDKIIAPNNSPITRVLGIPQLQEETSLNASFGFTTKPVNGFTATVDGYFVSIKDRIVLTGAFEDSDPDIGADLQALGVGAAQFFTNAVDTRTMGVDIVISYSRRLGPGRLQATFAGNINKMTVEKVKTNDKLAGKEDIYFATHLIVDSQGYPNHPTAIFPNSGNPNQILVQKFQFRFPLEPKLSEQITRLPMGPIGMALNGVVFFNPFEAGGMNAVAGYSEVWLDSCCGHPQQHGVYHYHKYPVCVKSPFRDDGKQHSPVIGLAFDGFPVYGPYESNGTFARDVTGDQALDLCNGHSDAERGYHYHVTPGRFPYVIGGYHGDIERANFRGPQRLGFGAIEDNSSGESRLPQVITSVTPGNAVAGKKHQIVIQLDPAGSGRRPLPDGKPDWVQIGRCENRDEPFYLRR